MYKLLRNTLLAATVALSTAPAAPATAQSYPIDCAILLCLSGGWPVSEPCTRARAEFIRRITPWPIEPPLQIWRCPMGAAFENMPGPGIRERLYRIAYRDARPQHATDYSLIQSLIPVQLLEQADIDISSRAFDFVRSIRVFDIRYSQGRNREDRCRRSDSTQLGRYGSQGSFGWAASSILAVPRASGLSVPAGCRSYSWRSVFVEWRDSAGGYGFEEVRY